MQLRTTPTRPGTAELRSTAAVFNGYANVDSSWLRLLESTRPGLDLARGEHRTALLRWLNSWGCRIRYPREGEPDRYDEQLALWWQQHGAALPSGGLAELTDSQIDLLASAFGPLAAIQVSGGKAVRTLGPTAAAKALYALRPQSVMPWDAAIAQSLHGTRDAAAFGRHLRLGRAWAQAVLTEAGTTQEALPELVGRPAVSLAKLLDEYLYLELTVGER
ncbi:MULTISPECIES: hypothetical protein [unclassified Kitasatospora]|uniref:hypothetical protein n=1 Tax=unclassified Kitasatospora TaxID=2633591 RepID=UPI002476AE2A|nr:hypothetical protein [Kitasatospora sp. MAP12-44]